MGNAHPHHHRPRAHPAHPIPPAHIQAPPPPPAPPGLNATQYLVALHGKAIGAIESWKEFGVAVQKAYNDAYTAQAAALREVKEIQEARRKEEEALIGFALNALTIGVGGGLATAAEKYIVSKAFAAAKGQCSIEGAELVKKFVGGVSDKVADKGADQVKEVGEWAYKFGHPSVEEAFKPPEVAPMDFGLKIQESIQGRAADLARTVASLTDPEVQRLLTTESARFWCETITQMPFVREAPPPITADEILPNASAALWIAWALQRDRGYWRKQASLGIERNAKEEFDFEPVRRALSACGIQAVVINKSVGRTNWEQIRTDRQADTMFQEMLKEQKVEWKDLQVIDMNKFITWANSSDVMSVLFKNIKHVQNKLWFDEVAKRIAHRQRYGAMARYVPMT